MNATLRFLLLLVIAACIGSPTLHADDTSTTASVTELTDLGLESDGEEVTMIFKVTKTQSIGGAHEVNSLMQYYTMPK